MVSIIKKKIHFPLVALLLLISPAAFSKPDWISIEGLYDKLDKTQDTTYLATIFFRCSALQFVMAGSIEKDFGESQIDMIAVYRDSAAKASQAALWAEKKKREERGAKPRSDEERFSSAEKTIEPMATEYVLWMNDNQLQTGDRIDEGLKRELLFCSEIVESL